MRSPKEAIDPKAVLAVQIEMLQMALDQHEESWKALGFATIPNPIAERLRQDITEKKSLLALNLAEAPDPAAPALEPPEAGPLLTRSA